MAKGKPEKIFLSYLYILLDKAMLYLKQEKQRSSSLPTSVSSVAKNFFVVVPKNKLYF
jgi:hypothetical protein